MSASRLIHERNMRAKIAREEERRGKARKEQQGQEYRSPRAELVRRVFDYMTRGKR